MYDGRAVIHVPRRKDPVIHVPWGIRRCHTCRGSVIHVPQWIDSVIHVPQTPRKLCPLVQLGMAAHAVLAGAVATKMCSILRWRTGPSEKLE